MVEVKIIVWLELSPSNAAELGSKAAVRVSDSHVVLGCRIYSSEQLREMHGRLSLRERVRNAERSFAERKATIKNQDPL